MDSLNLYSKEVNKVSDELESGSLGGEDDCIIDFTTNEVMFVFIYVYEL